MNSHEKCYRALQGRSRIRQGGLRLRVGLILGRAVAAPRPMVQADGVAIVKEVRDLIAREERPTPSANGSMSVEPRTAW